MVMVLPVHFVHPTLLQTQVVFLLQREFSDVTTKDALTARCLDARSSIWAAGDFDSPLKHV